LLDILVLTVLVFLLIYAGRIPKRCIWVKKNKKKQHGRQHNMVVGWLRFNKANRTRGNMPIASERPCFQDILTISAAKLTRHSRRTLKNAFCQHNQSSSKVQITMHSRLTRQEQRVPKIFIGKSTHEPLLMCSSNARPKRANLRWNGGSGCRILNRLNIVFSASRQTDTSRPTFICPIPKRAVSRRMHDCNMFVRHAIPLATFETVGRFALLV
jgi:hypothetical protein